MNWTHGGGDAAIGEDDELDDNSDHKVWKVSDDDGLA